MYRDGWVRVEGVWLHYQDWPAREASPDPPILLLHGLTQQSHTFDDVARRLSARRRCLALDIRGRGESGWAAPDSYVIPQYVQDVRAFLRTLGLPAVDLFGTSMGGLIALSLAAVAPELLLSLGLNDIGPEIDPRGADRIAGYTAAVPASFPSFAAVLLWARAQYPFLRTLPADRLAEYMAWAVRREPDGAWRLKWDPAIGRGARPDAAVLAAAQHIWWDAFARLRVPVLLVWGEESDILSRETAARMAGLQPGLVRVDVAGVGHTPTLLEPAVFAALDLFYRGTRDGVPCGKAALETGPRSPEGG